VPGVLHQGVLALIRDDPWLGFDLLGQVRPVDGTPIDRSNELDHDGSRILQINPVYPDVVLIFEDPINLEQGIVICLEAQRYPLKNTGRYASTSRCSVTNIGLA
jgi:hypothetical protein